MAAVLIYAGNMGYGQVLKTDTARMHLLREVVIKTGILSGRDTSATPVQILKGKDLEKVNGLSVADAVRYFSGVQLKDYGGVGGLKTINVRSMGTDHTGVFYDGVELGNAQNGQVDLGKFSLDNIEEVDLYIGQQSTIFQPAAAFACGDALYLKARQPDFENGRHSTQRITFRTGSFGLVNPSVLWDQKLTDRLYSSVSAETVNANGRYKFNYTNGVYDTTAVRNNGDIASERIEAGLFGKGRDSSGWSAKIYFYNSGRGLPGAIVSNNFNYDQRLWDRDYFFQANYHKDFNRYSLAAIVKYANDYTRYLDPDFVTVSGFLDNHYYEKQWYGSFAQQYKISDLWKVSLASDYRLDKLDADLYHFAYPVRQTILNALATEVHLPRLTVQGNILNTVVIDKVKAYAPAGDKTQWTPAVTLAWQPFKSRSWHVRAFYKNIFRMPTFNDLYYTFIGNTLLKPEYARQFDIGTTYAKSFGHNVLTRLSVQADAYYNLVTDKIIAVPGANLFRWTMMNLGKVQIKGVNVNAQSDWKIACDIKVTLALSYTHEQALDITGGQNDHYKQLIPYAPLNNGSALIGALWKQWALNYSYIYTGYRYDQAANIPANYVQPWYIHDVALSYTDRLKAHVFKLSAEVNNLLNQYYDIVTNFPMPGRNYRFTFQLNW